jgi:hypothetical protein
LNLLVLLQTINRTSLTLPTELKNSSRSLARIRCDSCITNTVLASLSSGLSSSTGEFDRSPRGDLGLLPKGGLIGTGEGERFFDTERLRSLLRLRRLRLSFSFLSRDLLLLSLDRDLLSLDLDLRSLERDLRRSLAARFLSRLLLLRRSLSPLRRLSRGVRLLLRRFLLELRRFLLQ